MTDYILPQLSNDWQIPSFNISFWLGRESPWCVIIPVINEGARIHNLLIKISALNINKLADIIIIDGGSTDGSLNPEFLEKNQVKGLLVKTGAGKLSAQLRCAYSFALKMGYQGIVTIDGNDKDDPCAIPDFINALQNGIDFVQASRFIIGGVAENTPKIRELAIKYIHAPLLSLFSGFRWTDSTQGFRAYSRELLLDRKIGIFRDIFSGYELLAYLTYRSPKLGYTCIELPTIRRYPEGIVPTKIDGFKGNISILKVLFWTCLGLYNPSKC